MAQVARRLVPSKLITTPPLQVRRGQELQVGERSEEWPAFVFVTAEGGEQGWVPARILRIEGTTGRVLLGYDTTTLNPEIGDELEAIEEDVEGGWLWCRDSQSRTGWFPKNHLNPPGH
jgi:hypothetical protein